MSEDTARLIMSILWTLAVLIFYGFLVVGVVRLAKWLGRTVSDGVQAGRYKSLRAQGKSDGEIQAILDEHPLERHWWILPIVAVIIVTLILPPGGIVLGLIFLVRLAVQWPHMQEELRERARLRAERAAGHQDPRREGDRRP